MAADFLGYEKILLGKYRLAMVRNPHNPVISILGTEEQSFAKAIGARQGL